MSVFNFIRGITGKLGVGTQDLGFMRSSSLPITNLEGPGIVVGRSFGPTAPGYVKMGQQTVPVSMLGTTGIALNGNTRFATLAQKG